MTFLFIEMHLYMKDLYHVWTHFNFLKNTSYL